MLHGINSTFVLAYLRSTVPIAKLGAPTLSAGFTIEAAGDVTTDEDTPESFEWLKSGAAGDWEARLTKSSGTDPTSGTLNSWLSLGTDKSWEWQEAGTPVLQLFSGTLSIRRASDNTVFAIGTINVTIQTT